MFAHYALGDRRRLPSGLILAAGIAALLAATPAFAASWTWTGAAGNNSWNNSGNWNPVSPPTNDGNADIIFGATPRLTPDLTLPWNVNSVTFNNTAGVYTLFSTLDNTLTVGAGGITNNDADTQDINHPITLSAAQTWSAASGWLLCRAVNNGGNLLTTNAATGKIIYIYGVLSGSGGLTKIGLGTLVLQQNGPNTFAGTTTVNAGTLILLKPVGLTAIPGALDIGDGLGASIDTVSNNSSNQIADSATVSVFSTGAWGLSSSNSETITNLNIVSTGIAGGGLVTVGDGTLTILGNVTMTGGTVTATGAGTLVLNGSLTTNAAAVAATISSKLDLNNGARTFTIADGVAPNDLDVTGVVSNGGIIKAGPGTLRLSAANTYAGGTTLNAGTILIGHDSALGTGLLTGNGGTLRADGAARTIANAVTGSFAVDGAFDLTLNSSVNVAGNITKNGSGTLIFAQAATFDGLTVNAGAARFDAGVTFAGGLTNSATVLLGTQTLTVNGAGLNNQGSLPLAGGMLAGSGSVVNNGLISGTGIIGGTGGFTNNAQLTVSGGNLTLAKTGANANAGNVAVPAGLQLRFTGGTLANTGTVDLAGGVVAGTATLSNNAGGAVSGRGTISAPFANAGTLRAVGGTMNVTGAFTNSGVIRLDDGAGLAGGAITNTGRIQGDGTLSNALTNSANGSIRVDVGKTLFFTGAFAANAGEMNLQGGTLDFAGAVTNSATGFIAGRGALYTGGLTNNGQMAFSGGAADIHGDVTLTAGSRVVTSGGGATTTFFDDMTHNGAEIFTGAGASSVFFGALSGAGPFTGTGAVYSIGDLRPGNSPATVSFGGSLVLGSSTMLTMELGGATPGTQYDRLVIAGSASLAGTLAVSLIDSGAGQFEPAAGDSFDILDWGSLSGTFASIDLPALTGLAWDTSQLYTTGVLAVVPVFEADFDEDGDVDGDDLVRWRNNFGTGTIHTQGDADTDGDADGGDFLTWQRQLGSVPAEAATAVVPEPGTFLLFIVASAGFRRIAGQKRQELINE